MRFQAAPRDSTSPGRTPEAQHWDTSDCALHGGQPMPVAWEDANDRQIDRQIDMFTYVAIDIDLDIDLDIDIDIDLEVYIQFNHR